MKPTKTEIRKLVEVSSRLAVGAGAILKQGLTRPGKVRFKGRIDPVTEFDLKSERYILGQLKRLYPDHRVLTEESEGRSGDSSYRWIIDPLDGTVNYSHGFPIYCVSIAVEFDGQLLAGAIFDPERKELFSAGKSIGARLNGKRIGVSRQSKLHRSLLATGFAYDVATARRNNLGLFARMIKSAQAVRRAGSAALDLCWLACGRFDGFWELDLYPWDTAAAILVVEEAGGKISRLNGRSYGIFDRDLLASNGRIHNQMQLKLSGR